MKKKRTVAFIAFYIIIIVLMIFTYVHIQKYYSHEAIHQESVK